MASILSIAALFFFIWGFCSCWSNYEKPTAVVCLLLLVAAWFLLPLYFPVKLGFGIVTVILSMVMLVKSGDAFDSF